MSLLESTHVSKESQTKNLSQNTTDHSSISCTQSWTVRVSEVSKQSQTRLNAVNIADEAQISRKPPGPFHRQPKAAVF